jgi:hypothetical protein
METLVDVKLNQTERISDHKANALLVRDFFYWRSPWLGLNYYFSLYDSESKAPHPFNDPPTLKQHRGVAAGLKGTKT